MLFVDLNQQVYYAKLIAASERAKHPPGGNISFPHACKVLVHMEKNQVDAANSFLKDIHFIKSKISHLNGMLEALVE